MLAQAILQKFPEAKLAIGPAIDEGFYYDFDLPRPLTPEDLDDLEARMVKIIDEKQTFKHFNLSRQDATAEMTRRQQTYKLEIIDDLNLPEYSFYENGPFVDLCRGPHVENTKQVGAIKLLKVSGAYWRGDSKNKMLQRVYGTAFPTKQELADYLKRMEEAEKRDHRQIGKDLDLFSVNDEIGGGLILWHPKGAMVRYIIEEYWRKAHLKSGYKLLYTPHVGKAELWEHSGHLGFYRENMYPSLKMEEQEFFVKPMNCPFHIHVYSHTHRSYRDLPMRLAELGTVYRHEMSGVLHGLLRVRGFTQDDAHIICTPEQVEAEILSVLRLCMDVLKAFGFEKYKLFLSTKPKEKAVGSDDHWRDAEAALRRALELLGLSFEVDEGGGAFYGPKIDLKIEDAIGRLWQCSTVQFDFNLPERFDMTYVGPDGQKKRPIMIHRALLGSIERFFGVLIEHYEGKFPFWLAPVQVKVLTLSSEVDVYAQSVMDALNERDIRCELDGSSEKIGYKIRIAAKEKVPFMVIIGKKEAEKNVIAVRDRAKGDLGQMSLDDFLSQMIYSKSSTKEEIQ